MRNMGSEGIRGAFGCVRSRSNEDTPQNLKLSTKEDSNMKARLAVSLILLLLLVKAHPAMATWGSFVSLGTNTVNSDPSCAPLTGGGAVCAARSFTNTMLVNQFNGTAWTGWKNLAGAITSAPSCAP